MKIKRIALIGLGAMGVFFAPRLYEAFGDDFYIIRSMASTTDFRS